jgi:hypothetical protein
MKNITALLLLTLVSTSALCYDFEYQGHMLIQQIANRLPSSLDPSIDLHGKGSFKKGASMSDQPHASPISPVLKLHTLTPIYLTIGPMTLMANGLANGSRMNSSTTLSAVT